MTLRELLTSLLECSDDLDKEVVFKTLFDEFDEAGEEVGSFIQDVKVRGITPLEPAPTDEEEMFMLKGSYDQPLSSSKATTWPEKVGDYLDCAICLLSDHVDEYEETESSRMLEELEDIRDDLTSRFFTHDSGAGKVKAHAKEPSDDNRGVLREGILYDLAEGWKDTLEEFESLEDPKDPDSQLTTFERNLLETLRRHVN